MQCVAVGRAPYNGEKCAGLPQQRRNVRVNLNLADGTATAALGAALGRAYLAMAGAAALPLGAVMYLEGELGAGKTSCVRAVLRAVGVEGTIRSPTYTLLDTYLAGGLICVHTDLYRLQSRVEVDELGLRDLVGPATLLLIEWPERGFGALPRPDLELKLDYAGEGRLARLRAPTAVGRACLDMLVMDSSLSAYVSNLT
jgi:tRNA threonylcarbamoyladenosine biosynthesis protein TsaE